MLKWNTQKQHPNNSSNNGQEVDNIFADISTRYVTDIQCAIDAKTLDDNNDSEQKETITRKNENSTNHSTSIKHPNLVSIITHKDGNNKTITGIKEPQNNNEMSTNVIKEGLINTSTDMSVRQDNDDSSNKHEYGCHIVTRNPKFLASISYPKVSQSMYNIRKPPINATRKESRVRQNRSRNQDGVKMHPKKKYQGAISSSSIDSLVNSNLLLMTSYQSTDDATLRSSSESKSKHHLNEQQLLPNESRSSTGERNKETQYYMVGQNANDENNDIDPRAFHRQGIHPSREQLSFDELGKVYTNISKRRMVSKVHCPNIHWHSAYLETTPHLRNEYIYPCGHVIRNPALIHSATSRSEPYLVISGNETINMDHRLSSNDLRIRDRISEDDEGNKSPNSSGEATQNNVGEPRKRSSGENTYMTVPSGSEDTASSDDVYSSVPDTSSDNMDTIDEKKGRRYQKGDKLGPLPAVPKIHSKKATDSTNQGKAENDNEIDENNNAPIKGAKYNMQNVNEYEINEANPGIFYCHCEESICRLPNGTKFNPFYLREMRKDGIRKQTIETRNVGGGVVENSGSATCSTCTLNSNGKLYCCDGTEHDKKRLACCDDLDIEFNRRKQRREIRERNLDQHLFHSKNDAKELDELERGQFEHYHENNNNNGRLKGLHFPHALHGHPPFMNTLPLNPNFSKPSSKIKPQSHVLGVPFYHLPPPVINPAQEFKYHKHMRKRYTNLRRRAGVERRIKITAYISVVIVAIVVLIVVGAILAVFFHVNPDFFHDMMKVKLDNSDPTQREVEDSVPSQPVEIR